MYMICEHYRMANQTKLEAVKEQYHAMVEGEIMVLITVANYLKDKNILEEVESLLY